MEQLQRAIAEYEAARGRVERDAARVHEETRTGLVKDLLPVLDSLDRAAAAGGQGVDLIRAQLDGILRGYGLERYDATGRPFDPHQHEAMAIVHVDDPAKHGVVVEQWEPGYRINGKILRPARVTVGRA